MGMNRKEHWEKVYKTKELSEVGWFQEKPVTSLKFIEKINPPRDAKIIDVGGGAFFLVDYLLEMSFTDLTVLDISKNLARKKQNKDF
jgi:predicted TPR repeat methyltransferase